ncbi:uromodulin-like [Pyxicephalus adspersus]|uniref:uromodulin-like n=1 Tax=Pyxicephalus adspersus TaxID=30357 RepID=UPI003B5CD9C6
MKLYVVFVLAVLIKYAEREDFHPTLSCDDNIMTVSVSKCKLEALGYDPQSMHLKDSSENCNIVYDTIVNGERIFSLQSRITSNWCGNTLTSNSYVEASYNGTGLCESCGGSCDSMNGCACANGLDFCFPSKTLSCNDFDPSFCCPSDFYYDKNQSCCIETAICVEACAADENCTSVNCTCNTTMYQNLKREDFHPTLSCEDNIMTVSVSKCKLEALGYDPQSIHLKDTSENCNTFYDTIVNGERIFSLQSRITSNWCGNTLTSDDSNIYLSNTIHIGIQNKSIITVNPISFNFTCTYKRNIQTILLLGNVTTGTVSLSGINGTGSYPLTMAAYKDSAFAQPFRNDDIVTVGTDIYVGLFVNGADGNIYVLRVETCVASPTANRNDTKAFQFITDGCPGNTVSTTLTENGKSLISRFRISAFQFQNENNVYLFCDARLCDNSTGTCSGGCGRNGRSFNTDTNEVRIDLNVADKLDYMDNSGKHTAASWALLAVIQLAFAFIKLI